MQDRKIRLGVVGLGYIAMQAHLPLLLKMRGLQVVALCDRDQQRLERAKDLFRVAAVYTDLAQMLEEQKLDIVDICTPPDTHKALCLEALNAGCNVMVEKPLTTNVADADLIINTAKEKRLALHVLHNQSYSPAHLKAKKILLQSGEIGEVLNVEVNMAFPFSKEWSDPSHWVNRIPGGPLGETAPHAAFLLLEFLDTNFVDEVQAVAANASGWPTFKADALKVIVKAGKRIGSFLISNAPISYMTTVIMGTKLTLFVDNYAQIIVKYPPVLGGTLARGRHVLSDMFQRSCCIVSAAAKVAAGQWRATGRFIGHKYLFQESLKEITGQGVYPVSLEKVREAVRILEIAFKQTGLLPE